MLRRKQITGMGGEWFKCTVDDVRAAIIAVRNHKAFGTGAVVNIQKGMIVISFGSEEKKFQFPGAFQQGFLRKA